MRDSVDTHAREKRTAAGIVACVGVSALAFLLIYWVLAPFVAALAATTALVLVAASDWSTFEERELARARKRGEKRLRTQAARKRDRLRWHAHQASKAVCDKPELKPAPCS